MPDVCLGVTIDYARNETLTDQARDLLKEKYCREGEDVQEAFARACVAYASDPGHAQRLYDYVSRNWFMFSSPVLSNAPLPGETPKGLPIACFGGMVEDSLDSLISHGSEISWLSVRGGGTSGHWSSIRAVSKKAPGPIPFMQNINAAVNSYKQGVTRRASYAAYLDVSHPDIMEFLQIRNPTGGDINRKCLSTGFHHGVNITDKFMHAVENDWGWALIDPHTQEVRETMRARELWEQIMEMRYRTGEPYMFFIDKARRDMPKAQKMKGLTINGSNLCVAPETMVLTDRGHRVICMLEGQTVNVWNGNEWSEVIIRKTSDATELWTVKLSTGQRLDCTSEHKWFTETLGGLSETRTHELATGDIVHVVNEKLEQTSAKIVSIERDGRISPTFCFTEPKRHMGVFNGILTGNCNEIVLPTNDERTFVCCLSSLNAATYDDWKGTLIVEDLLEMLDNVIQSFIDLTDGVPGFERSRFSAMQERATGIGVMGLHSLFQKKSVAFGSQEGRVLNDEIFKTIRERADAHSLVLGSQRGEAPDMEGTGRRNSCTMAVAPNANSGMIAGVSPSIEPWAANAFTSESRIGSYLVKNPEFEKVIWKHVPDELAVHSDMRGHKWVDQQWKSIIEHSGSVQHLDFLSDHEKAVFRTSKEIDQMHVIELAADRQKFIDQSQSLNLFFPKLANKAEFSKVHYMAWKLGCKGLYYVRTEAISTADPVGVRKQRTALKDHMEAPELISEISIEPVTQDECESCSG